MKAPASVAVASHSFPKHPTLRRELLDRFPDAIFNETGRPLGFEALVALLRGHERAITGLEVLSDRVFVEVPELRIVSKYGVGLDMIDLEAARRHGVSVRWTPGVNRQAVAELTIGFMIALARRVVPLAEGVRRGTWQPAVGRQLSSAVVGIIGCGQIGQRVAVLCRAFGARVLAHDIRSYEAFYAAHDITPVDLPALLAASDIVTVHVPLDESTHKLMGAREFAQMRRGALFINTARGGVVDEIALMNALEAQQLGGAAADVFEKEPLDNARLAALPNFLATPHIGAATEDAMLSMGRAAIAALDASPQSIDLTGLGPTPKI